MIRAPTRAIAPTKAKKKILAAVELRDAVAPVLPIALLLSLTTVEGTLDE